MELEIKTYLQLGIWIVLALIAAYFKYKQLSADKEKADSEVVTKTILEFVENLDKHYEKGMSVATMPEEDKETHIAQGKVTKNLVKNLIEKVAVRKGVNSLIEASLDKFIR